MNDEFKHIREDGEDFWSSLVNPFLHFASENVLRTRWIPQKEKSTALKPKRQKFDLSKAKKKEKDKRLMTIWGADSYL